MVILRLVPNAMASWLRSDAAWIYWQLAPFPVVQMDHVQNAGWLVLLGAGSYQNKNDETQYTPDWLKVSRELFLALSGPTELACQ